MKMKTKLKTIIITTLCVLISVLLVIAAILCRSIGERNSSAQADTARAELVQHSSVLPPDNVSDYAVAKKWIYTGQYTFNQNLTSPKGVDLNAGVYVPFQFTYSTLRADKFSAGIYIQFIDTPGAPADYLYLFLSYYSITYSVESMTSSISLDRVYNSDTENPDTSDWVNRFYKSINLPVNVSLPDWFVDWFYLNTTPFIDQNSNNYQQGSEDGYESGYQDGYNEGDAAGFDTGYQSGLEDGRDEGYEQGRQEGYTDGYNTGKQEATDEAFEIGYDQGYDKGYNDGNYFGYDNGFNTGKEEGLTEGYDNGYKTGYTNGYNKGQTSQVSNPIVYLLTPVHTFLDTNLFGSFSLGDAFNVVLFVAVAVIFIKMFAGG